MIYLICQDWINTSKNHAGMKYLCMKMQELNPALFCTIVIPQFVCKTIIANNKISRKISSILVKIKHRRYLRYLFSSLNLNDDDVVFVVEYMDVNLPMFSFVKNVKKKYPKVVVFALAHLVPSKLNKMFDSQKKFSKWTSLVDCIFTFGHSLTSYFISRGVEKEKIETTLHYVDDFYRKSDLSQKNDKVKVIAMGNQMRNVTLLKKIVDANLDVSFIICQGVDDMTRYFRGNENVELIPFVEENDLRNYMDGASISLNVMDDTIGSNVIVTSMSMGMAMVCSDVGSIRDYCDETNTIFCTEEHQYSEAIQKLIKDENLLSSMRKSSFESAQKFSIEKFMECVECRARKYHK